MDLPNGMKWQEVRNGDEALHSLAFGWVRDYHHVDELGREWDTRLEITGPLSISRDQAGLVIRALEAPGTLKVINPDAPEVVCLCGSTRFFTAFEEANYRLTLAGKIVLTVGCDTKSDAGLGISSEQKRGLDELHKRKIDLADSILVLNVGGYVGDSTRSEIEYAESLGKQITYLEVRPKIVAGE